MVVNNDFSKEQSVSLSLHSSITSLARVSKTDGSLSAVALSGGKLKLTLPAGDGELFALPEGLDFAKQITPAPIGTNLAADAGITCNSSTGTSDQYMDNLNDGNRACEANGTLGWTANGTKQTEIIVDIGYVTRLNRVDIYPAGSGKTLGKNFGKVVVVSTSEDGKSWQQVSEQSGINARAEIPSLTFDAVNARYVKLDISGYTSKLSIAEIEIFMDDGTVGAPGTDNLPGEEVVYTEGMNIALNRPFEVSSQPGDEYVAWGWAGKFINDGVKTNGWTSNVKIHDNENSTEYVVIDFGDTFAVDKVVVAPITDLWPVDFEIYLSEDGENWISIAKENGSSKPSKDYTVTLAEPIKATMIKFEGTKLRSTAADGYMLQLAEIEAYGTPVCDKSALQSVMEEYVAAGGDTNAQAYVKAVQGMDNALLTSSSMNVLIRTLKAAFPVPEQTTEQGTEQPGQQESTSAAQDDTDPDDQSDAPEPAGGCKSAVAALVPLAAVAVAMICLKKKKEE